MYSEIGAKKLNETCTVLFMFFCPFWAKVMLIEGALPQSLVESSFEVPQTVFTMLTSPPHKHGSGINK